MNIIINQIYKKKIYKTTVFILFIFLNMNYKLLCDVKLNFQQSGKSVYMIFQKSFKLVSKKYFL